jgi:hypothetical protein
MYFNTYRIRTVDMAKYDQGFYSASELDLNYLQEVLNQALATT